MKTSEFITQINENNIKSLYHIEDLIGAKNMPEIVIKNLNIDRFRWYEESTTVFKCQDGFVGVTGPSRLYSESMTWDDVYAYCIAEEYEEVKTISYRPKLDNKYI